MSKEGIKIEKCPYCGSENFEHMGENDYWNGRPWHCHECDCWFNEDDYEHEMLRHIISAICSGHFADEENPLAVSMPLGENDEENCGLSSLDLPWINSVFQFQDGTMWANVDGYEEPVNFDDISTDDLRDMLKYLTEEYAR